MQRACIVSRTQMKCLGHYDVGNALAFSRADAQYTRISKDRENLHIEHQGRLGTNTAHHGRWRTQTSGTVNECHVTGYGSNTWSSAARLRLSLLPSLPVHVLERPCSLSLLVLSSVFPMDPVYFFPKALVRGCMKYSNTQCLVLLPASSLVKSSGAPGTKRPGNSSYRIWFQNNPDSVFKRDYPGQTKQTSAD
jgi:hypothetical protein